MNKLEGFYELKRAGIPSVPWKKYDAGVALDDSMLWTIRSAVVSGPDLNLPRKVGVTAAEAKDFADHLTREMKAYDLIVYYPFFVAEKSGVMEVTHTKTVVEAVKDDLWNLVTLNNKNVTIVVSGAEVSYVGDEHFVNKSELTELLKYASMVKRRFRTILMEGKSVFLEWSYAYISDIDKLPVGNKKLIFYEIRSVV